MKPLKILLLTGLLAGGPLTGRAEVTADIAVLKRKVAALEAQMLTCCSGGGSGSLTISTNGGVVGVLTFSAASPINVSTNGVVFGHL
jgi:hypothetical protein